MFFTDTQKLNKTAYNALKRIRENKEKNNSLVLESASVTRAKFNSLFADYSDTKFKEKVNLDSFVYNKLLENIQESEREPVSTLITEMLKDVQDIYKFINIEPKNIGFVNMSSADTKNSLVIEASNIINNFMNKNYYSLSKDEKHKKYKDSVINFAHNIVIEEGLTPQEAIEHSYKTAIIENLLNNINFPFVIKHKLNEVFEDDIYNDFFDIGELHSLKESVEIKIKNIARVISVLIK